ncbi:hypothetical protein HV824_10580 [Myxococcus sp. AM009]|uniref:hypothetical protein n=1 Tax=unclassified Myxococcus TaxID=2648731 RepID=UPI001595EA79|nr:MULTISPECIES: hypothetical protein [unclassified Myxococcus]NVI98564.1 hypothetical protein [Myxococcus sp. AM009]NVJ15188.1 hypothetical protein [Myxococcus sp. AM010]
MKDVFGLYRVRRGCTWTTFQDERRVSLQFGEEHAEIEVCGLNDPLPDVADDESRFCVRLELAPFVKGAGPAAYTIDGVATVFPHTPAGVQFEAGSAHTRGVNKLWGHISCFGADPEQPAVHHLTGRLDITENSSRSLVGELDLEITGTLAGPCGGDAARVLVPLAIGHLVLVD